MKRRTVYILSGLALVAVVVVAWFMLISPLRTKIAETTAQVEAQQKNLTTAKAKLARMEDTKLQAEKNQGRLIELSKMVPSQDELPSLLLQIQDLATESGIEVMSIAPSKGSAGQGFEAISLGLQFSGTYFDVNDFIYRIEQLVASPGRLLAVKDVNLSLEGTPKANVSPALTVNLNVQAFKTVPVAATAVSK
jgi:type IV pilus assembly protein PilO